MTTGEALYLALVIVSITAFALVLAYYSRQQTRRDQAARTARTPAARGIGVTAPNPSHFIAAATDA